MDIRLFDKAFKIIRRNYGCPGADGVTIKSIKNNYQFHRDLVFQKYMDNSVNTLPIKQTRIIDYAKNVRQIYVYCLHERWLQAIFKLQLFPKIHQTLGDCVFAYRPGRNMRMLKQYVLGFKTPFVVHLDISEFFANINRHLLFQILTDDFGFSSPELEGVINSVSHVKSGLPQGNALSPILSNAYLVRFDNKFPKNYARFSDDLYFAIEDAETAANIQAEVSSSLETLGLYINNNKTEVLDASRFI